jgi:hypothetical protein
MRSGSALPRRQPGHSTYGKRRHGGNDAKADSVKLGSPQAKDVSIIVRKDLQNLYGNSDGLLGMAVSGNGRH